MTTAPPSTLGGEPPATRHRILLFVADDEPNSRLAKENLARICASLPEDRFVAETIDVLEDFRPALEHNILVTPCLLLLGSGAPVRVAGNLSEAERVRVALRLSDS